MQDELAKRAQRSLTAIVAAAIIATLHHLLEIGPLALVIALALIPAAYGLLIWFAHTKARAPLILYTLLNAQVVIAFGLLHGGIKHVLPLGALIENPSALTDLGYVRLLRDITGFGMSVAGVFVAWRGYQFLSHVADRRSEFSLAGRRFSFAPLVASLAVLGVAGGFDYYWTANEVRVAVIIPLNGPGAVFGRSFVKAVEMSRDDLGLQGLRIRLIPVDTSGTPDQARRAIHRAFASGRIDAVMGGISASGRFTAPHARQARIPHICVCSVQSIGDGAYNFTNIPAPEDEAVRWVAEARRRGIRTVALLAQNHTSIRGHTDALIREAQSNGMRIVLDRRFDAGSRDFTSLAAQARATNADVVYAEAFPPEIDELARVLRRQGVSNLASVVAPSVSRDLSQWEGAWYTDTYLADPTFERRFEARYPETRFAAHMTPYAYDSFQILARALESGSDPASYVRGVTHYVGAAGPVSRAPNSGNFRSRPAVWTVQGGRLRILTP